jgi:signal recognition particle GTPase
MISSQRHLSSSPAPSGSSSTSFSPVSWWRSRQEKKEEEKYKQRVQYMAQKDAWTIGDMRSELDEIVTSWASKLPGLRDNKETTVAKKMHKALSGIVDVLGKDATDAELDGMTRKQKLEAAVKGGTTVEEINMLTQQFQSMALMHRIVRKRWLESKPIPTTAEGMQALLQTDGSKHLSAAQKERLKGSQLQRMRKSPRRR